MDIKKRLEEEHSKTATVAIIRYIGTDKKKFKVLLDIFLKDEYRLTQRSAWALGDIGIKNPQLIKPYFSSLLKKLEEPGHHPSIYRNILRIFERAEIPEEHQSKLLDICLFHITDEKAPIAVRAFSITTATKIAKAYEELRQELLLILKDLGNFPQPPAISVRLKLALKELRPGDSKV